MTDPQTTIQKSIFPVITYSFMVASEYERMALETKVSPPTVESILGLLLKRKEVP